MGIQKKVLVTGGAGYIGSHACVELLQAGYTPIVVDNLSNSKQESLKRVEKITGKEVCFYQDTDQKLLDKISHNSFCTLSWQNVVYQQFYH